MWWCSETITVCVGNVLILFVLTPFIFIPFIFLLCYEESYSDFQFRSIFVLLKQLILLAKLECRDCKNIGYDKDRQGSFIYGLAKKCCAIINNYDRNMVNLPPI